MASPAQITDRAKRYRAQKGVTGPKRCVLCGKGGRLDVMHLTGNEAHGEKENLAYGCRSCNTALGAAFKRLGAGKPTNQYNPAKQDYPSFQQYMWAVSNHARGAHDAGGAIIHATPKHKRIEYARRILSKALATKRERADERWNPLFGPRQDARQTTPASGGIAHHQGRRPASKKRAGKRAESSGFLSIPDEETLQSGFKRGLSLSDMLKGNPALRALRKKNPAKFDRCVKEVQVRGGAANAYAVCTAAGTRKRNPAAASADAFEEFHGYAPSEVITVTKRIHYHQHLAAAGKLTHLDVWGVDGQGHHINGFRGAFLAFNEARNQLFVEGGDQSVNLEDFGIRQAHEWETLGSLTDIGYHTNKTHLGDEGGEATYVHKFRSTNEGGKHVVVKIARYPDLIYDVRNEQLLFSGGSYEILREGINK
jgi:hypothetical protein